MQAPVEISNKRNYWLIRTEGGSYFQQFFEENYVSIGWNKYSNIKEFISTPAEKMKKEISKDKDEKRPGYVYGQIHRFISEIKIGDVVIIPNEGSKRIAIGIVESDAYVIEEEIDDSNRKVCNFKKRRNVNWLQNLSNKELDPYIYKLLMARNTISKADKYADNIDRMLYSFFTKNDKVHLVLRVKKKDEVLANKLLTLINSTVDLAKICEEDIFLIDEDQSLTDEIEIKLNVQSPGPIEFIAGGTALIVIGYLMYISFGGKFQVPKLGIDRRGKEANPFQKQLIRLEKELRSNPYLKSTLEKKQKEIKKVYKDLNVEIPKEILSIKQQKEAQNKSKEKIKQ